jgi:hypothetical protein
MVWNGPRESEAGFGVRAHSNPVADGLVALAAAARQDAQEDPEDEGTVVVGLRVRMHHYFGNCSSNWADGSSAPPKYSAGALSPSLRIISMIIKIVEQKQDSEGVK